MIKPLDVNLSRIKLNNTLHGRSVYRRQNVPGHNVVRYYNYAGKGDAIDLFVPAGTEVVACHSGTITRVFDRGGILSGCYVDGGGNISVYAHLSLKGYIKVGKKIREGEVVGYVGRLLNQPHLHFELETHGIVISGSTPKQFLERLLQLF